MSTEKDVRQIAVINLADLVGKSITVYDNATGQAYGLNGQKLLDIAAGNITKSQNIATDTGSTEKVPVVAAVELELNKKVSKTGGETIAGIKTFSSSPLVPTPTANTQTANKKYVDDEVAKKQTTIVFGIANTNAVKVNSEDVAEDDVAVFTPLGIKGLSAEELLEKLNIPGHADYSIEAGIGGTLGHLQGSLKEYIAALKNVLYYDEVNNRIIATEDFVATKSIAEQAADPNKTNFLSFSIDSEMQLIMSIFDSIEGLTFEIDDDQRLILITA